MGVILTTYMSWEPILQVWILTYLVTGWVLEAKFCAEELLEDPNHLRIWRLIPRDSWQHFTQVFKCPKKGLNLYSRGRDLKIASFEGPKGILQLLDVSQFACWKKVRLDAILIISFFIPRSKLPGVAVPRIQKASLGPTNFTVYKWIIPHRQIWFWYFMQAYYIHLYTWICLLRWFCTLHHDKSPWNPDVLFPSIFCKSKYCIWHLTYLEFEWYALMFCMFGAGGSKNE